MPRKIDAFYVWLQIEPEGENMTYVPIRGINRRLFATDTERIRRLRPYAVRLHEVLGYPLVLYHIPLIGTYRAVPWRTGLGEGQSGQVAVKGIWY